jgi:hypothetical protein
MVSEVTRLYAVVALLTVARIVYLLLAFALAH